MAQISPEVRSGDVTSSRHGSVRFTGGYDVNLVAPLPARFVCPLCHKLMRDPIQILQGEGERACKVCYDEATRDSATCPLSGSEIVERPPYFSDKHAQREIASFKCYCNNKRNGCPFQGELSQLIKNHLPSCDFELEACPNPGCTKRVTRKDFRTHVEAECSFRSSECPHCHELFDFSEVKEHQLTCERSPRACLFDCGRIDVPLSELPNHMVICPKIVSGKICPFSLLGCQSKPGSEKSLKLHLQEHADQHAAMTIAAVSKLKSSFASREAMLDKAQLEIADLKSKIEEEMRQTMLLQGDLFDLQEKFLELERTLRLEQDRLESSLARMEPNMPVNLTDSINQLKEKVDSLQMVHSPARTEMMNGRVNKNEVDVRLPSNAAPSTGIDVDQAELRTRLETALYEMDKLEKNSAVMSANLSDMELKLQLLENTSYDGRILWKIDNLAFRMQQAVTGKFMALHSAPCYTKRFGYKFCTRLYLNGDGMGRNSHVSLFFVVMKGEYDALQSWPFSMRVTFKLLNHCDAKMSVTETFLPDKNSSSFQRPTKEMNIAAGCPMFVTRDLLLNGNFVVDDSIFIETLVTPVSG